METKHITDEHLIAYAAQELSQAEAEPIQDHLAVCSECNAVVVSFRNIRRLVRSEYGQEPLASTVQRAYAIFHQQQTNTSPKGVWASLFRFFMIA
jgi:anti-sigma factor RsiW